ncbi:hypothetical protein AAG906_017689 [Vitis piasezkii]
MLNARFKKLQPITRQNYYKRPPIWRRIEFSARKHYPVTTSDVGLIWASQKDGICGDLYFIDHPFGPIRACEEKLLDLLLHYVIKFQIPSVQVPITVPPALAWTDDLIATTSHEIKESPTAERTPEPRLMWTRDTNVDAENSDEIWHQYHDAERAIDQYQRGIQEQLRIMRGLMHKLGTRRHSGVNSDAGGHSSYAPASTPTADDHAFPDGEEQPEGNVVPTNRNVRRRRVRRMAPNLLSPYISQPQTKQSAIKIDLKQGELVSMHDTILTRGNLGASREWVDRKRLVDAHQIVADQHEPSRNFSIPYILGGVIGRFEPHLSIDIPYVNVNENHWTLYVYDLENRRIQLLDSRPGRKKTMLSGVQQNLAKVVLWLAAHKKEVSPYDLRTFNFITPDVPLQTNEHDCGVFVMKFMELWSMGGFSKSIDVVREIETLQVEDHGEYVVLSTKCTPRPCPRD